MSMFIKSNAVDKDIRCETVYERFIADTCDFILSCEEISDVLRTKLPFGCYTNFRDSLFHFRRLAKSFEESELLRQAFAVEEHANRAKTDAIVCLLEYCTYVLQILSHESFGLSPKTLETLIGIKNKILGKTVNLRLSGVMLDNARALRLSDEEFQDLIVTFLDFVQSDAVGVKKFHAALEATKEEQRAVESMAAV